MPPGSESRNTFGLTWIRADRLVGDKIADGFTLVGETAEPCPERTLERYWPMFAEKPWPCTVNETEWRKHGFEGSRLEYLAAGIGTFHEAHWAADD